MEILVTALSYLYLTQNTKVDNQKDFPFYGSVADADGYFYYSMNHLIWSCSENVDKLRALVSATRIIDKLDFLGCKADPEQKLQFPRGTDKDVPYKINHAAYEIAAKLLDGYDPDTEYANQSTTMQGFSGISRTEYDRRFIQPHIAAGVPSHSAWGLLVPFLKDPHAITLKRGS